MSTLVANKEGSDLWSLERTVLIYELSFGDRYYRFTHCTLVPDHKKIVNYILSLVIN